MAGQLNRLAFLEVVVDNHKKYLKDLTETVAVCLSALDHVMKGPSTVERGKTIAKISNHLDMGNDAAMHFGLGYGFKKIANIKKRLIRNRWLKMRIVYVMLL